MKKLLITLTILLFAAPAMVLADCPSCETGDIYCEPVPEASVAGYILTINGERFPVTGIILPTSDPDQPGFVRLVYSAIPLLAGDKTVTARAVNSWGEESVDSLPLNFARPALANVPLNVGINL